MTNRRIINCFFLSVFLFLFSILSLTATDSGSFTMGFSGPSSATLGETISVQVVVKNMSEPIAGAGATLNYDSSFLQLVDKVSGSAMTISYNNDNPARFLGVSMGSSVSSSATLVTYKFKTLKAGSTSITLSGTSSTNTSYGKMQVNTQTYRVNIKQPLSANTNLGSLSVSGTNINKSNMTASVGRDVTSVTINATAEDGGASVSGTGNKSLSYGKNTFTITVKAPSGATKDYVITINREDPRSTNNNLSSLKVNGGELTPGFSKGNTTYSMNVPFSVSSLDVKATAEDKNAKVSVSGNNNLPAEATTDVTIKVTAENGSVKTYVIKVTRGKDPNAPKSNNNYLASLTTNIGMLSPGFDREKTNYVIYLPFEVDRVELSVDVEDKKYGVLETNAPEVLNVGTNRYEFKVTAEDGTSRTYVVNVVRGANVDASSNNVILKDLEVLNGNLNIRFKSDVNVYRYDKKKDFKLTPIPEDENTKVTVIEHDDVYTILLEASTGETNIYTLIPEEKVASSSNNWIAVIITIVLSVPVIGGGGILGYKLGMKRMLNKFKTLNQTKSSSNSDSVVYEDEPKSKKIKKEKKSKNKIDDIEEKMP